MVVVVVVAVVIVIIGIIIITGNVNIIVFVTTLWTEIFLPVKREILYSINFQTLILNRVHWRSFIKYQCLGPTPCPFDLFFWRPIPGIGCFCFSKSFHVILISNQDWKVFYAISLASPCWGPRWYWIFS